MKKPLDKKCRDFVTVCLSSLLLVLAGCGESGSGPAGPPGAPRPNSGGPKMSSSNVMPTPRPMSPVGITTSGPPIGNHPPDKEKPPENTEGKTDKNPFAPVVKVEQAGNLVSLASEIIAAGVNPFLSRLPKPVKVETANADGSSATANAKPAAPPVDPLDAVTLLGIVYSAKSPIALISVVGSASTSQLVRPGDVITLTDGQATVARITQSSIDIHLLGEKKDKKTLPIPDIVGYGSSKASSEPSTSGAEAGGEGASSGATPSAAPAAPSAGMSGSTGGGPLSNLKKLADGLAGSLAGKSSGSKGPNVVLTEP